MKKTPEKFKQKAAVLCGLQPDPEPGNNTEVDVLQSGTKIAPVS